MNKQQRDMKIELLERELAFITSKQPACNNCKHYVGRAECSHWSSTVPADVLPTGCDEWSDDQVPF